MGRNNEPGSPSYEVSDVLPIHLQVERDKDLIEEAKRQVTTTFLKWHASPEYARANRKRYPERGESPITSTGVYQDYLSALYALRKLVSPSDYIAIEAERNIKGLLDLEEFN